MLRKIAEEKLKRDRERLKSRAQAAIDSVDNTGDLEFESYLQKTLFERFWESIADVLDRLKPFRGSIAEIKINYDRGIGTFYEIVQLTYVHSTITAIVFAYLIII